MRRRALCAASSGGSKYLTMEALENGFTAKLSRSSCEYSIDGGVEWKALAAGVSTPSINAGEKILFKANAIPVSGYGIGKFTLSKQCNLSGNCMSMLYGDDADKYDHIEKYGFVTLFSGAKQIIGVSKDFLPARMLSANCYDGMFQNCANMISAPDLPAKELLGHCYRNMFRGTKITNPPRLAATVLREYCCQSMFRECTSLQSAPALLSEELASYCYQYMFYGCTNLRYIKAMFLTLPSSDCTAQWVGNVASSGTFVKNKSAKWNTSGTNGVPKGWTVITE